jgi:prepilin signal peptidase PulO-like enzyme (type II secretory pathway)
MVPDKALLLFSTVALASPVVNALGPNSSVDMWSLKASLYLPALLGAVVGFTILLAAAIASKGGTGVGGGDIKLAAVLGFIHGSAGVMSILFVSSLLALPSALICKKRSGDQRSRLPFVPFIAIGCLVVTIARLI